MVTLSSPSHRPRMMKLCKRKASLNLQRLPVTPTHQANSLRTHKEHELLIKKLIKGPAKRPSQTLMSQKAKMPLLNTPVAVSPGISKKVRLVPNNQILKRSLKTSKRETRKRYVAMKTILTWRWTK